MPSLVLTAVLVMIVGALAWMAGARRRPSADVDMFAGFMEYGPFVAFMKDANGRYIYENRAIVEVAERIHPGTKSLIGKTDLELFDAPMAMTYRANDQAVIQHGKPLQFEERSVDADGTVRHWSTIKFPRRDDRGRPCVAGITIDVTALRQARSDARVSVDRCSLALEAGRMGDFTLHLTTQLLDTSPLFATLHGRPETKTRLSLEESLAEVHLEDRPKIIEAVQAAVVNRAPSRIEYRVTGPDGVMRWVEIVGQVFTGEAGQAEIVRGVGFDITEKKAAYDEIARRRAILRRLIDVQENERQTLCHDLHDGLLQYAIGAKMQLESTFHEKDAAERMGRIRAAVDCLDRGIAEGRQVIRGVRPSVLDDLGLTAAIADLAEQMLDAGITVGTDLDECIDAVPPMLRTTIYRVVQEALTNARKHAGSDRATVEVRALAHEVHVRVRDHGSGFDIDDAPNRGFGVVGMSERVRLAGGRFWIESQPGFGTQVNACLPIPAGDAGDRAHENAAPNGATGLVAM